MADTWPGELPFTQVEMNEIALKRAEQQKKRDEMYRIHPPAIRVLIAPADLEVQLHDHLARRMRAELSWSDIGPSGSQTVGDGTVPASPERAGSMPESTGPAAAEEKAERDITVGGSGDRPEGRKPTSPVATIVNSDDAGPSHSGVKAWGDAPGTDDKAEEGRVGEAAMTHEEAAARFSSVRENVEPVRFRALLRAQQAALHPEHVSMQELSEKDFFAELLQFFREAASQGKTPTRSYTELEAMLRKLELEPESILGGVTEQKWNIPSPSYKQQPGLTRNIMAWTIFLNILKRLARVCGSGTKCPNLVNVSDIRDPWSLAGLHFDHDVNHKTNRIREKFMAIGNKADSDQRAKEAVAELVKCNLLCGSCHDQGEESGGSRHEKRTPADQNR